MMDPAQIQATAAVIGTAVVICGVGWKFFRAIGQFVHMIDDMAGTKARKGRDASPGIMERLAGMEHAQATQQVTQNAHTEQLNNLSAEMGEQSRMLKEVNHEVHFNNGSSVKDSQVRTEKALKTVVADVAEIKANTDSAIKAVAADVAEIKQNLITPPDDQPAG